MMVVILTARFRYFYRS